MTKGLFVPEKLFLIVSNEVTVSHSSPQECFWAIGSGKGAKDLQDFTSMGQNVTAFNAGFEGMLQNLQKYYVTVKCRNGAGLEHIQEEEGL